MSEVENSWSAGDTNTELESQQSVVVRLHDSGRASERGIEREKREGEEEGRQMEREREGERLFATTYEDPGRSHCTSLFLGSCVSVRERARACAYMLAHTTEFVPNVVEVYCICAHACVCTFV